jgi:threonine synthase
MNYVKGYQCTICHKHFDAEHEMLTCPVCGELGILDIEYDYEKIKRIVDKDFFLNNKEYSIWRYMPLLPVDESFTKNTLKVGWTPLYRSINLARKYGIENLYFKDDGLNPTQSLKDRASVIACVKALEQGYETISCSSTGNAASSLAGNAAKLGLKTVIFVPKRAPIGKLTQLMMFGSTLIKVDGDYKAAFKLSKMAIDHYKWYNRNAAINPNMIEGKKTVALEIAEQLDFNPTDWVVVSVGDGCTIGGVYKGFYDLKQLGLIDRIPKILGVQSTGCDPFYKAFHENKKVMEADENTIADSIAVGIPRNPVKGINAVKKSNGDYVEVSDDLILQAMKILGENEGIFAEPAASASLAGMIQAKEKGIIKDKESVTVIVTGNGLKDPKNAAKAISEPITLKPNLEDLIKYIETREEAH